jgi:hypothetical protein
LGLIVPFAGCSTASSPSGNSAAFTTVGGDGGDGSDGGASLGSMVLKSEPFTVPPGGDITHCTPVRGTNAEAIFTHAFHSKQSGHHIFLYSVSHPIEGGSFVCPQGGQWNWNIVLASQKPDDAYEFPEGVGFKIEANQQFIIETHLINPTDQPMEATSEFDIDFADPGAVKVQAGAVFFGTTNIALSPRAKGHAEATCKVPTDLHIGRFFGHTHRRGTDFTVSKVTNGTPEAPFYTSTTWEDPPVLDSLDVKAGEFLKVGCDYNNESDKKLGYPDEMCVSGGMYWPANGTLPSSRSTPTSAPAGKPSPPRSRAPTRSRAPRATCRRAVRSIATCTARKTWTSSVRLRRRSRIGPFPIPGVGRCSRLPIRST